MGKEEIARNEQFLLFAQCFQLSQITVSPFVHIFDTVSLFAAELEEPKSGLSGKGLRRISFIPLPRFLNDPDENALLKDNNGNILLW